jgi:hypothetical protein
MSAYGLIAAGLLLPPSWGLLGCASGSSGDTDSAAGAGAGSAAPSPGGGSHAGAAGGQPTGGAFGNSTNPNTGTGGGGSGQTGCNDLRVSFDPQIPTVLLLVDRSGSMWDFPYGASPTRWQAVYDSVMAEGTGVVQPLENEVRFGLMTYTGNSDMRVCPVLSSVAPALGNYQAMKQIYDEASTRPAFKADTPTGPGLRGAIDALAAVIVPPDEAGGPKVIVLITDGEPDTCATPDPSCGQDESIAAVQAAQAMGIATFVIGISSDVGTLHLQDLANAGAGLPVRPPDMTFMYNCINPGFATMSARYAAAGETPGTAPVYQPADPAAITSTLRAVIRGVHGCGFALHGEVDLEKADLGTVRLDDTPLLYEDANGWRMRDSRTLELMGDACARLQVDASRLEISFPCDVVAVD